MKVFRTKFALHSLPEIHKYYKGNVSIATASNIKESIFTCTKQLEKHPLIVVKEELLEELAEGHKYLVRGNYKIIYKTKQKKYLYN